MSFNLAPSVIYFLKLQDHFKQNSILVGKNRKQRCLDLNGGHAGKSFAVFFFIFIGFPIAQTEKYEFRSEW